MTRSPEQSVVRRRSLRAVGLSAALTAALLSACTSESGQSSGSTANTTDSSSAAAPLSSSPKTSGNDPFDRQYPNCSPGSAASVIPGYQDEYNARIDRFNRKNDGTPAGMAKDVWHSLIAAWSQMSAAKPSRMQVLNSALLRLTTDVPKDILTTEYIVGGDAKTSAGCTASKLLITRVANTNQYTATVMGINTSTLTLQGAKDYGVTMSTGAIVSQTAAADFVTLAEHTIGTINNFPQYR